MVGLARAERLRQDHADARDRRGAAGRWGERRGARDRPALGPAPPRRLRHPGTRASTTTSPCGRTSAYFRRMLERRRSRRRPRHRGTDLGPGGRRLVGDALRRPARPRCRWRSPCSARRSCWSSTSRPSGWTRCCASNCGRCSTALAADGTTLLVSSHVMDEAARCDRLLLMRDGRVLADDTPAGLLERHRDRRRRDGVPAPHRAGDPRRPSPAGGGSDEPRTHARHRRPGAHPDPARSAHPRAAAGGAQPADRPGGLAVLRYPGLRSDRPGHARAVPVHRHVPGHEHRHAARAAQRHPRAAAVDADRQAATSSSATRSPSGCWRSCSGHRRRRSRCGCAGSTIEGSVWLLFAVAVADALLGTALGLLASAFARTEFQVVQFMPVLVFPQILLGGIFLPRDQLPEVLRRSADWLPLSPRHRRAQRGGDGQRGCRVRRSTAAHHRGIVVGSIVLGSITLRRRTP